MGRIEDLGLVVDKGLEWKQRAVDAEAERDQLRTELIKVLRFVGGQATADVSTAFLLNVGEEVSAVLAGMTAVTARSFVLSEFNSRTRCSALASRINGGSPGPFPSRSRSISSLNP